jgi:hypothetical protein
VVSEPRSRRSAAELFAGFAQRIARVGNIGQLALGGHEVQDRDRIA